MSSNFGSIHSNLVIAAGESVRRNAADNAFEAFTPLPAFTAQSPNLVYAGPGSGGSAVPAFRALVAADIPNLSAAKITSGLTNTRIPYFNGTSLVDDSNLVWDNSNKRLGIGTPSPNLPLHIFSSASGVVGFRVQQTNSGSSSQVQNVLENDAGYLAYYGIGSSNFSGFAPIDGGKAFFGGYQNDVSLFTQSAKDIIFYTTATERARLTSAGDFGLSSGGKLTVGTARFLGYTQSSSNPSTSDYPNNKDWGLHKETINGKIFLAYNLSGVILKVELT